MTKPVCVIVGAGPGNGLAFTRRFAAAGYRIAALARSAENLRAIETAVPGTRCIACDATDPVEVERTFTAIAGEFGPVEVLIYNVASRDFADLAHTTAADFEQAWRTTALGSFLAIQAVAGPMRTAGRGTIIIIGATASVRGGAGFVAFSAAKAAQRSLAESIARDLGPAGVHVAHVVIDAVIDMPASRRLFPDRPDEFFARPDVISETVYFLSQQPRSAWTFELDLRPFGERW